MRVCYMLALFILSTFFCILACKKNNISSTDRGYEMGLSDSTLAWWDLNAVIDTTKFSDLAYPDGANIAVWLMKNDSLHFNTYRKNTFLSGDEQLRLLIGNIAFSDNYFTTRSNFPYPNGISYVWGSKDYINTSLCKDNPPADKMGVLHPEWCICNNSLHGLDCSGFIYQLFNDRRCGLNIPPTGSAEYSKENIWNTALNNSSEYDKLYLKDVTDNQTLQCGDIIVSPGTHIGIILQDNDGNKIISQCIGGWSKQCSYNSDLNHGPIHTPLTPENLKKFFKDKYQVLRFSTKMETTYIPIYNLYIGDFGSTRKIADCFAYIGYLPDNPTNYSVTINASAPSGHFENSSMSVDQATGGAHFLYHWEGTAKTVLLTFNVVMPDGTFHIRTFKANRQ